MKTLKQLKKERDKMVIADYLRMMKPGMKKTFVYNQLAKKHEMGLNAVRFLLYKHISN